MLIEIRLVIDLGPAAQPGEGSSAAEGLVDAIANEVVPVVDWEVFEIPSEEVENE